MRSLVRKLNRRQQKTVTANKKDFFNDLLNQISESLYLTDKTDGINEEINSNNWILAAPKEIISQSTTIDFLEFILKVKHNYKNQLNKSTLDIDLLFYMWFDEMAGQLRFNLINSNHDKLPFGCKINHTDRPEEIIDEYLKSNYHDGIPWNEFESDETPEQIMESDSEEVELVDNFVLTVYQEKIIKQK
ncbi:MAG TPA: hypothetical protein PK855_08920 [Bacteroidales bacterium]|nr:hypothetical protein [Bacteroidales bacterium]